VAGTTRTDRDRRAEEIAMSFTRLALFGIVVGMASIACAEEPPKAKPTARANRLAKETSPYLLLHAHNPVDWYPWGPEAFAKAKAEGKPIFLSVGYSSCYWCHVMERESFSDPAIAKALNQSFVCIKVDREERPDVDSLYMTALQAFHGSGGWPMTMFLLPDGRPFFGGTYFPPHEREGNPGFDSLLSAVSDAWRDKRELVERDAAKLTAIVKKAVDRSTTIGRITLSRDLSVNGVKELAEQFDPDFGGFGFSPSNPGRPKFPEPVNLVFLLDQDRREGPAIAPGDSQRQVITTLDHMARGGIRDHLAGGYHRYSTRRDWSVPHFEKMLYDNAQLATVHLLAFERTHDPRWRTEAEATFAFVARSMTSPEGGFYSALDAESEAEEGLSYVWTRDEVNRVLGEPDAALFRLVYGLDLKPNFDETRYVLLEPRSRKDAATDAHLDPETLEKRLAPLRKTLLDVRDRRPAPLRDDKILTAWNGLMIAAYADGFRVLKDPGYRAAAEQAADFLLAKLRTPDGRLLRTYRVGQAKLPAYLEDYAFLAHGLLRLHAATGDPKRLAQAKGLTDRMIADFEDPKEGGFFYTAGDHESLLARPKDPLDNALPSANSVAVRVLVALGVATGDGSYLDRAGHALDAFSASLGRNPAGSPLMLVGLDEYLDARGGNVKNVAAVPVVKPSGVVTATGPTEVIHVVPGGTFEVVISLNVRKGYHIYANPAGPAELIPTTVDLARAAGFDLDVVAYPVGLQKVLVASGPGEVALYENDVKIKAMIDTDPKSKPGPRRLVLKVRYQACNDKACLAPTTIEVPVMVEVGPK
jgi:uncharacterized protein YyaL (SSP411 family)